MYMWGMQCPVYCGLLAADGASFTTLVNAWKEYDTATSSLALEMPRYDADNNLTAGCRAQHGQFGRCTDRHHPSLL